jgi:hypothetical protein
MPLYPQRHSIDSKGARYLLNHIVVTRAARQVWLPQETR